MVRKTIRSDHSVCLASLNISPLFVAFNVAVAFEESSAAQSSLSSSPSADVGPKPSKLTEECLLKHSHEMQQKFGPSKQCDKADSVLSSVSSQPPVDSMEEESTLKDNQAPIATSVHDEAPDQSPDDAPIAKSGLPGKTEASTAPPAVMTSTSTPRDQGASKSTVKPATSQRATAPSKPSAKPMSSRKNLVTPGLLTARKSSALLGKPVDASEIGSEPSGKKNLLAQLERSEEGSLSSKPSSRSEDSVESEYNDNSSAKLAKRKKQQAWNKTPKQAAPPKNVPPRSVAKPNTTMQAAPPKKAPPSSASKRMSRELKALQLESSEDESDFLDDASHSSSESFYIYDNDVSGLSVPAHPRVSKSRVAKAPLPIPRRARNLSNEDSDSEISESHGSDPQESKTKKTGSFEEYKAARLKARMEKKRGQSGRSLHVHFQEDDGSASNNSGTVTAISRHRAFDEEDDDDYYAEHSKAVGANEGSDLDYDYSFSAPSLRGKSRPAVAVKESEESVGATFGHDGGFFEGDDEEPAFLDFDDEDTINAAGDSGFVSTEATRRSWPFFHDVFFGVHDDDAYNEMSQQEVAALVDDNVLVDDDENMDFSLCLAAADQCRHTPKRVATRLLSLLLIASLVTVALNPAATGARTFLVTDSPSPSGAFQFSHVDAESVDETSSASRISKSWMDWIH
jgi:hypothetical protein